MATVRKFQVGSNCELCVHATVKREGAFLGGHEVQELVDEVEKRIQKAENAMAAWEGRTKGTMDVANAFRKFGETARKTLRAPQLARELAEALGEPGIVEKLRKLPVENILQWEHVEETCRTSGGYQSHLLAPDQGARALVAEAVELTRTPALEAVEDVHHALRKAIDQAAEQRLAKSQMPKADAAAAKVARECLEEWRAEAIALVNSRIDMEKDYVRYAHKSNERERQGNNRG